MKIIYNFIEGDYMFFLYLGIAILVGYLMGSIPTSLIISKSKFHIDIRDYGSKNLGGTNTGRVLGRKWGAITYVLDVLKTALPVLVISLILKAMKVEDYEAIVYAAGCASLIGHCYPVFAQFKGGKAVACSFGFLLSTNIVLFFIALVTIIVVVLVKKYVSLGSMVSIFLASVFSLLPTFRDTMNFYLENYSYMYSFTLFVITIFVVIRHKKNLIRLLKGEESKVKI
jgi:glycerol-3-phosphate acyltransferase PlsY